MRCDKYKYLSQQVFLLNIAVFHDLPLPMSFFKLQPEMLHLFLQADQLVAFTPLALLILHQFLLQLFYLGGVG